MLRFNKKLTQIFLEAKSRAMNKRNVEGISTIDLFSELIEDSESLIYSYISQMNSEKEISRQLFKLNEKFAKQKGIEYPIDKEFLVNYSDSNKKETMQLKLTTQLYSYIEAAHDLAKSMEDDCIAVEDIVTAIIQNPIKPITKFLRILHADIPELREELEVAYYYNFEDEKEANSNIPGEMQSYLSVFSGDNTVLGRNREIESTWNILLKKTKRNVILVGEQGVGKTAIVKKMVAQIKNGTAPK